MIDLYIYYQVEDANAAPLQAQVAAMQRALLASHGVAGQLKRRPDAKDGVQTWMEVYPRVPADFPAIVDAAARHAGLLALSDSARHAEIFMDLIPCA